MNTISQEKTPEQMAEAIFTLDLDPIKFKLMDSREGYGWSREQADRNELEYKRFLALLAKFPDELIVPSTEVDKFWHGHILDTMKYAEDCENIFGYFLHHFPYFGMRGEEDAANLATAAAGTQRLYEKEFGKAGSATASYCVRAGGQPEVAGGLDAAYCVRASGQVALDTRPVAAYCVRAAASYCVRAGGQKNDGAGQGASYCVRAAGQDIVIGNGRPKLEPVSA